MPHLRSLLTLPSGRAAATLLTVLAASVTLGACTASENTGSTELSGEEGRVQDVVEKFTEYADDDRAAAICKDLFTPEAQTAVAKGADCAKAVQTLIDATDFTALDVDSVKITGTTAVATIVKTKRATEDRKIVLVQDAAKAPWKISAFGNEAAKGVDGSTPEAAAATTPDATPKSTPKS
ncbi:MAG: hypothetical protein Q7T55_18185 [Solirubrobacteraceae bacterium]|nr:hypothetical protein [Solirubrobacteraceae bacterium]